MNSKKTLKIISSFWNWIFLLAILAFLEIFARTAYEATFLLNPFVIQSVLLFTAAPLLIGIGQTFVIISGGIDLSVAFAMGLASVVFASIIKFFAPEYALTAVVVAFMATSLIMLIPGFINGTLISRLNVPPFIGTLGMYGVARGVGYLTADGMTVPFQNDIVFMIGTGKILGIPIPVIIALFFVLLAHYLLAYTKFGQHTYALGGNRQAAIRSGINIRRQILLIYMLCSVCAGMAGMIYAARFSAGAPQAGEPLMLDAIAAVFIGGASFFGGSGKIIGTVIGALIIANIQFGIVFIDIKPFWQFVVVGVVIIIAVVVDQSKNKLSGVRTDE
ncbi:ribose ABC transporter [Alphaproteobacteria bacterium]|nr:ribose ABC transporter [Alphaproteobacteria bacterium]